MKRLLLTSCAALVLWLAAGTDALASCVCVTSPERPTPEQARAALVKDFNEAFAVFTGEVVESDTFKVKLEVDKIWKGIFGDEIVMRTGAIENGNGTITTTSCEYYLHRGDKYLIFTYGNSAAAMMARACTRTKELKYAEQETKDLELVAKLKAPKPKANKIEARFRRR